MSLQNNAKSNCTYFDVLRGLKAVELVEELQHSALHFAVAVRSALGSRRSDRVDLVHEDDGRRSLPVTPQVSLADSHN
jgi:hypothetical protein